MTNNYIFPSINRVDIRCEGDVNAFWTLHFRDDTPSRSYSSIDGEGILDDDDCGIEENNPLLMAYLLALLNSVESDPDKVVTVTGMTFDGMYTTESKIEVENC